MLKSPEFYVLVAFVIFFVLFGRQLWTAATKQLDGRADAIRTQLAEAEALRIEAEQMLRDAQVARQAALDEARDIINRGRAEPQSARRERMALDRISAAEKAAVVEVRETAADIAATAARSVISSTLTADDDAALVDHAIAGLPKALRAA